MEKNKSDSQILKILLKQFTIKWGITSLAKEINMTRVGIWKVLKKLEVKKLISLSPIGEGKTSTFIISLNWENPLLEKTLELILIEDALKNQRWISNFIEIKNKEEADQFISDFLTPTEKIMLAKRLAIAFYLKRITTIEQFKK